MPATAIGAVSSGASPTLGSANLARDEGLTDTHFNVKGLKVPIISRNKS
jgi:hypothetical protein